MQEKEIKHKNKGDNFPWFVRVMKQGFSWRESYFFEKKKRRRKLNAWMNDINVYVCTEEQTHHMSGKKQGLCEIDAN